MLSSQNVEIHLILLPKIAQQGPIGLRHLRFLSKIRNRLNFGHTISALAYVNDYFIL